MTNWQKQTSDFDDLFVKTYNVGAESTPEKRLWTVIKGILLVGNWDNDNYAIRSLGIDASGNCELMIRKVDANGDEVNSGYYYLLPASSFTENTNGITFLRFPDVANKSVVIGIDINQAPYWR